MAKPLVLITGAIGLIGFRTLVCALQAGYAVRVAIRKSTQESEIRNAASIQPYIQDVSFILVPDMAAPSAYDTAVEATQYAIHVASPTPPNANTQKLTNEGKTWKEM